MKLYAESPGYRARQILQDVAVVVWIIGWTVTGATVHGLVARLAVPGENIEQAGSSFERTLNSFGDRLSEVPVVGEGLQQPFEFISQAGGALERAGRAQQNAINALAVWLGVALALIPISLVVIGYLPGRRRWMREAGAAQRLRISSADLHLFALRALARRPLHELRRVSPDPAAALLKGDYEELATLELRALGLRGGGLPS
jgi:hypothetical protein